MIMINIDKLTKETVETEDKCTNNAPNIIIASSFLLLLLELEDNIPKHQKKKRRQHSFLEE